jgi:hypothetical protein
VMRHPDGASRFETRWHSRFQYRQGQRVVFTRYNLEFSDTTVEPPKKL